MPTHPPARPVAPPQAARPQPHAPWHEDLSPPVARELTLAGTGDQTGDAVDVAVIGGGVAGLSAALAARAVGARVLVLEGATALGQGATGRNAGILSAGVNMALADLPPGSTEAALWPATTGVLLALAEQARQPGTLLTATLTGALSLAERPGAVRHLAREARARVAAGLRAELWTPSQVAEATAGRLATHSVVAALWLPDEGRVDPLTLLAQLAREARAAGVVLAGAARVEGPIESASGAGGHCWHLTLAGGRVLRARGLVVATGPTQQPTSRIYALALAAELPAAFPLFWDAAPYTYCDFRLGNGRLVVSGGRYARAGKHGRDALYHKRLAEAARRWLPELQDAAPTHAWAVDLAVAANMVPAIRALGAVAPGMAIEGLGALGVLPGIVLGRRAGDAVARALG